MLRTLTVEQYHKCLFSFDNLKVCSRSFSPIHTAKGLKKKARTVGGRAIYNG